MSSLQVKYYETPDGKVPFLKWFRSLDDGVAERVEARIDRMSLGNRGAGRHLGGGLHEAKLDFGPGYRVYYGLQGHQIILLLCGGDKSSQGRDIERAGEYWKDYLGG